MTKRSPVDASLIRFIEGEVRRVLGRFAIILTRVEIHLNIVETKVREGSPPEKLLMFLSCTGPPTKSVGVGGARGCHLAA